jgi:hypothetical protein
MKLGRVSLAVAMLALAASGAAAQAQMPDGAGGGGFGGHRQHHQKAGTAKYHAPKADEKAYAAALKTVPDRPFDPWHGVR